MSPETGVHVAGAEVGGVPSQIGFGLARQDSPWVISGVRDLLSV